MISFFIRSSILTVIIILTLIIGGFMIYTATILLWKPQSDVKKHDAIIVLTGAAGRIEQAFQLLLDEKAPQLLISGVIDNATFQDIVDNNSENLSNSQRQKIIEHCCIAIDYIADTTITNAIESKKWITDNNIQSIILVTSGTHMPRAYFNFAWMLPQNIIISTYPYHPQSRLSLVTSAQFWHSAAREYLKFGGTFIRLLQF
jgi:uncharacterized SAM-binding protein YcdF (DUF218 family)